MVLSEMKPYEKARIVKLKHISPLVIKRMNDLGIVEGAELSLKRLYPFNGPLIIECQGQMLSFRHKDANGIEVDKL